MKKTQKILSAALSAALVLSAMAVPAFADGEAGGGSAGAAAGGSNPTESSAEVTSGGTTEGGTETPAEETKAAQIGTEKYDTVAKAIEAVVVAVDKTAEIKLLKDVTESINIPKETTVTLDLNGLTLTNETNKHTITNYGTLIIKDTADSKDGTVDNVSHACAAVCNYEGGNVTLNGGTYTRSKEKGADATNPGGNSYYTIKNWGIMTINDGVTVSNSGHYSSMLGNGYQDGTKFDNHKEITEANVLLTINGGKFTGGINTIKNDDWAKLTINGGTFENYTQQSVMNWNEAEISGGTFTGKEGTETVVWNGFGDDTMDKGKLTISGGTFSGDVVATDLYSPTDKDGKLLGNPSVKISGGTFTGDIIVQTLSATTAIDKDYLEVSGGAFGKDSEITLKPYNKKVEAIEKDGKTTYKTTYEKNGDAVTGNIGDYCASGYTYVTDGEGNTIVAAQRRKPSGGSTGGGGSSTVTSSYSVTFNTNGGSTIAKETVEANSVLEKPTAPTKEGYDFAGWYTDKELTTAYDFTAKITKNLTLYAAWAEKGDEANQIILTIGEKTAKAFGETKTNDVAPKIVNDRTMLPARFVAESLGAKVDWDEEKQLVTIVGINEKNEEVTILITIDSDIALVNGEEVKLDSPAFIENDRTYTPLRFISENLGAKVDWNEEQQKVTITKLQVAETAEEK